jgi:hypothetical protein
MWLNLLVDDHQYCNIKKLNAKKKLKLKIMKIKPCFEEKPTIYILVTSLLNWSAGKKFNVNNVKKTQELPVLK